MSNLKNVGFTLSAALIGVYASGCAAPVEGEDMALEEDVGQIEEAFNEPECASIILTSSSRVSLPAGAGVVYNDSANTTYGTASCVHAKLTDVINLQSRTAWVRPVWNGDVLNQTNCPQAKLEMRVLQYQGSSWTDLGTMVRQGSWFNGTCNLVQTAGTTDIFINQGSASVTKARLVQRALIGTLKQFTRAKIQAL